MSSPTAVIYALCLRDLFRSAFPVLRVETTPHITLMAFGNDSEYGSAMIRINRSRVEFA